MKLYPTFAPDELERLLAAVETNPLERNLVEEVIVYRNLLVEVSTAHAAFVQELTDQIDELESQLNDGDED